MENFQEIISKLMLIGITTSLLLVGCGGIFYLWEHGTNIVSYSAFHAEPTALLSIAGIWRSVFIFSARAMIQLGLLVLVVVQILRVALTGWYFVKLRDSVFVWISLFILAVLLYTALWRF